MVYPVFMISIHLVHLDIGLKGREYMLSLQIHYTLKRHFSLKSPFFKLSWSAEVLFTLTSTKKYQEKKITSFYTTDKKDYQRDSLKEYIELD